MLARAESVCRWTARLVGGALVALSAAIAVGQGLPNLPAATAPELVLHGCFVTMLIGFVAIWWRPGVGGAIALAGVAAFYATEILVAGRPPSGWVLPLCFAPGLLALVASALRRRSAAGT